MANNLHETVETRWCIEHERYCSVFFGELGIPYHVETKMEETISGEPYTNYDICHGPFTVSPQPDQLTEAEWSEILSHGEELEVI